MYNFKFGSAENAYTKAAYAAYMTTGNITEVSAHENVAANYGKYTFAVANAVIHNLNKGEKYNLINPEETKSVSDMNNTSANDVSSCFDIVSVENLVTFVSSHVIKEDSYNNFAAIVPATDRQEWLNTAETSRLRLESRMDIPIHTTKWLCMQMTTL